MSRKRLEACVTHRDITDSKLSRLQKRILVYARQAMIEKEQKLPEPKENALSIGYYAPDWLSKALVKALKEIFEGRKRHFRRNDDGEPRLLGEHPWLEWFEEVFYVERMLTDAAQAAGVTKGRVDFNELYQYAGYGTTSRWSLMVFGNRLIHPWPYYDGRFYFRVDVTDLSAVQLERLNKNIADEADTMLLGPFFKINCTIPELLRDLYDFPVADGGYIEALAFAPDEIGKGRYNTAQAALRRACTRLMARDLIIQRGRGLGWFSAIYERAGIGLTEKGVAVADGLIAAPAKSP